MWKLKQVKCRLDLRQEPNRRGKKMKQGKIIQEPEYFRNRCPFCYEKLGMKATWKRKIKKVCYCPNCHKKIDERFLVY